MTSKLFEMHLSKLSSKKNFKIHWSFQSQSTFTDNKLTTHSPSVWTVFIIKFSHTLFRQCSHPLVFPCNLAPPDNTGCATVGQCNMSEIYFRTAVLNPTTCAKGTQRHNSHLHTGSLCEAQTTPGKFNHATATCKTSSCKVRADSMHH